ncbi:hypothetical protein [Streptodolium elevatio]|uniref:Uncharacterized protein n=1 Tax=Streptodolium elevatio TaxID=3157996 RepID=A0ABV3DDR3_9ACTN
MDDLFRFLLLRPANLPAPSELDVLYPDFLGSGEQQLDQTASTTDPREAAAEYLESGGPLRGVDELSVAATALAVHAALAAGPIPLADLRAVVAKTTTATIEQIVANAGFDVDRSRLANTLVAVKLVSGAPGIDARGLGAAAQAYDALSRAADGADPVPLRPLVLPEGLEGGGAGGSSGNGGGLAARGKAAVAGTDAAAQARDAAAAEAEAAVGRIDTALAVLGRIPAASFAPVTARRVEHEAAERADAEAPGDELVAESRATPLATSAVFAEQPWLLSPEAVDGLDASVRETVEGIGVDLRVTGLPVAVNALHDARIKAMTVLDGRELRAPSAVARIGNQMLAGGEDPGHVGEPSSPMPAGHGSIRPVGIGDLLLVKQHVLRYEGGELAHVENVLKSERMSRDTRRLERTETSILTEQETTKEEERDTQTTDRFSLKRETSETLKRETEFKAGVSVEAKYGPFIEVKANADFGTKASSEETARQASEFSKDVVSRSVSKVVERVLERRTVTTLSEFEEKYSHGFDNTAGAGNISGVYQWVDKVLQAQVYNYGKRMLFDVTLPEPSTAFVVAQLRGHAEGQTLVKPLPFTETADGITETNYARLAHRYNVTGLEAPPPPVKTISKGVDVLSPQDPYESSKSQDFVIEDGYEAQYALLQRSAETYDNAIWILVIGRHYLDGLGVDGYRDMTGEVGSTAFSSLTYHVRGFAMTIEIFCRRTERAYRTWQLKTHAAITAGYLAKVQAYESALAEAAAQAGVVIAGRNPLWNQRLVSTELRKQCLTLLTAQQFDAFGALETSAEGHPQPNLERSGEQMPYVRFFEQAFEWEHLAYFFYPYFWGWKPGWRNRMLLDDVDPQFSDFLRAGAARAVFPVRPGFEAAVVHYLETGEIWNGGPPPDITGSTYVPIVKEIQEAQGAPGNEVPQGEPWLVRLPTTLAKLRPDDKLPKWKKVGQDWQPDE